MNIQMVALTILVIASIVASHPIDHDEVNVEEPRGKKKKAALLLLFADLFLKKILIVKVFYAFMFWMVMNKAGFFLTWFLSYLKTSRKSSLLGHASEYSHPAEYHHEPEYHHHEIPFHSGHHYPEFSGHEDDVSYSPYKRALKTQRR